MQGVPAAQAQVAQLASQPPDKRNDAATAWLDDAIKGDLEADRQVMVHDPGKVEMYSPPAVTNRVANGIVESSKFVHLKVLATAVDASEVQQ